MQYVKDAHDNNVKKAKKKEVEHHEAVEHADEALEAQV